MDRVAAPPTWIEELLEVLQARRRLLVTVAAGVAVLGILLATIAPGILPPTAGVGASVGIAACLLAVAAVVGVDAGDLEVQGARHVRSAGADVMAVLRGDLDGAGALASTRRLDAAGVRRVALVPADSASRDAVVAIADGLGRAWARGERRVLVVDLTRPRHDQTGLVDVATGDAPLGQTVTFDPELMLARLGAGADLETALVELPALVPRLPADIERLAVALPPLVDPAARAGATALPDVLVVAIAGQTSRVDLLATLEALDVIDIDARVLLHRPDDAPATAPPVPAPPVPAPPPEPEPAAAPPGVAPRPVPAARERDSWVEDGLLGDRSASPETSGEPDMSGSPDTGRGAHQPTAEPGLDEPEPSGPESAEPESAERESGEAALDEEAPLLGLAEIEREIERESRVASASDGPRPATEDGAPSPRAAGGAPTAADHRQYEADDLTTAVVLETLAQEAWARDDLDGEA